MELAPLKIGIACFPLIGGSGILATALGSELARRGHEIYFFSYAQPVRLALPQEGLHFHRVEVVHNDLFPCPDYTLPLAVKMAEVARSNSSIFFMFIMRCHMHWPRVWPRRCWEGSHRASSQLCMEAIRPCWGRIPITAPPLSMPSCIPMR